MPCVSLIYTLKKKCVARGGGSGVVFVDIVYTPGREAKRDGGELGRIMALGSHDRLIILD
jgi:hypothetical protein